jgi:RNase P subunit RPR2
LKKPNRFRDFDPTSHAILAFCLQCGHTSKVNPLNVDAALTIPQLIRRLKCHHCNSKDIEIRITYTGAGGYSHS